MTVKTKKSLIIALTSLLIFLFALPVSASEPATAINNYSATTTSGSILLDDKANLLTPEESRDILEKLESATAKSHYNIAIATTNDLGGMSVEDYSDNYFNTIIRDQSETNDYVLLTVDIGSRKLNIGSNNPESNNNLTTDEREYIRDDITSDLTNGNYYNAFTKFISDSTTTIANIGKFPWTQKLGLSAAIGAIIAVIISLFLRKQLKSVEMKPNASDYIRDGSMNITKSNEYYLYSTVTKTPKPKNNSSDRSGGNSSGSF